MILSAAPIFTLPLSHPAAIFLLVLVIILCGPLVFRLIRIPNIVGLILAGMAVGPHCLNILARDASFEIFGQVGILYLMFLAAVEIDMYHLRKNLSKGGIFGLISFIIPFAAGLAACRLLFDCSWSTSVLLGSMFGSHTLITYPVVNRFGLQINPASVIAVCGTIVAVLLALLALAEVVGICVTGSFDVPALLGLLVMMGIYAAAVGYSFPWLTRWFFRRFNDSVSQYIFILALVFVAALLAQIIGLESILGAFYAGLVLNRFIPSRSALMRRTLFVGNALFIPYFLIGVGMLINVNALFMGLEVWKFAAVMIGVSIGGKWMSAFMAQKMFHLSSNDRGLIFGLTSGKAAATIAATMIGFSYGLLSEDLMNAAVIMILGCCIVASVATERSARKMRMIKTQQNLNENNPLETHYARQLVAVANPITAEGLMNMALLMRYRNNREAVTTLFVRSNDNPIAVGNGREALTAAAAVAASVDIEVKEVERYDLNIVAGVTNVVKEQRCTDIILGFHRKSNIVDSFYGSTVEQLLASTNKMIFLSRCFIPVDTVRRIYVTAPRNAEYETGFHPWVERVANLASQLSCHVVFITSSPTDEYIATILREQRHSVIHEFHRMDTFDDFILLSGSISVDDLLIVVSARKGSISWSSDMDSMPAYLARHFARHNIMVIYPEQFGG